MAPPDTPSVPLVRQGLDYLALWRGRPAKYNHWHSFTMPGEVDVAGGMHLFRHDISRLVAYFLASSEALDASVTQSGGERIASLELVTPGPAGMAHTLPVPPVPKPTSPPRAPLGPDDAYSLRLFRACWTALDFSLIHVIYSGRNHAQTLHSFFAVVLELLFAGRDMATRLAVIFCLYVLFFTQPSLPAGLAPHDKDLFPKTIYTLPVVAIRVTPGLWRELRWTLRLMHDFLQIPQEPGSLEAGSSAPLGPEHLDLARFPKASLRGAVLCMVRLEAAGAFHFGLFHSPSLLELGLPVASDGAAGPPPPPPPPPAGDQAHPASGHAEDSSDEDIAAGDPTGLENLHQLVALSERMADPLGALFAEHPEHQPGQSDAPRALTDARPPCLDVAREHLATGVRRLEQALISAPTMLVAGPLAGPNVADRYAAAMEGARAAVDPDLAAASEGARLVAALGAPGARPGTWGFSAGASATGMGTDGRPIGPHFASEPFRRATDHAKHLPSVALRMAPGPASMLPASPLPALLLAEPPALPPAGRSFGFTTPGSGVAILNESDLESDGAAPGYEQLSQSDSSPDGSDDLSPNSSGFEYFEATAQHIRSQRHPTARGDLEDEGSNGHQSDHNPFSSSDEEQNPSLAQAVGGDTFSDFSDSDDDHEEDRLDDGAQMVTVQVPARRRASVAHASPSPPAAKRIRPS
ncbi:hypothetical protein H696_03507 [Fonticula alba]|uniref:Uncharacterized protein n=1 Tax=Fonticula alba TaxID=691883 RepID=A0A058Z818_FONAL|nr:hypothetical protein H696_03507 [Fonticula alba]KCV70043.1 hypothetical protein H696_03507 [Fonticula alba]|eukprot:XP_009495649.1 hypothetical protein H696_03507 [Fonticula alba]